MPPTTSNNTGMMRLCDVPTGSKATIVDLSLTPPAQEYLMRLGFIPGSEVEVVRKLPFNGPVIYRTLGSDTAIRHDVSQRIFVQLTPQDAGER